MPSSHPDELNEIAGLILRTDPESVLDVGVGFGKYGVLAREYLELWDGRNRYGDWKRRIDGIEAFADYLTPLHEYIYDRVHVGNALDILPSLEPNYDLILLIDVLEHFDYSEGMRILELCMKIARNTLISTPKKVGKQEDAFGNPFEAHKFQWEKKHFDVFKDKFFLPNERSLICYAGEDAPKIKRDIMRFKKKVRKLISFLK